MNQQKQNLQAVFTDYQAKSNESQILCQNNWKTLCSALLSDNGSKENITCSTWFLGCLGQIIQETKLFPPTIMKRRRGRPKKVDTKSKPKEKKDEKFNETNEKDHDPEQKLTETNTICILQKLRQRRCFKNEKKSKEIENTIFTSNGGVQQQEKLPKLCNKEKRISSKGESHSSDEDKYYDGNILKPENWSHKQNISDTKTFNYYAKRFRSLRLFFFLISKK